MKNRTPIGLLGILAACLPPSATGQDFDVALQVIQEKQKTINQRMAHLGFPIPSTSGAQAGNSSTSGHPRLFQLHDAMNGVLIPAGRLLFGRTYFRLVVGSENAPAMLLLEEGQGALSALKLMGKARASSTEGRLLIDLDRILLRSGKVIPIQATVLDEVGAYGLQAQVFSGKVWAALGATASSFLSGMAASQETLTTNAFGFSQSQPSGRNAILQGVAQAAADQSKKLMEEATREKTILVIECDTPVTVLVNEEVRR